MKEIIIHTEYITLGQFLKLADLISTGGEAKLFLSSEDSTILINGTKDKRRGRKLRAGDILSVNGFEFIIKQNVD